MKFATFSAAGVFGLTTIGLSMLVLAGCPTPGTGGGGGGGNELGIMTELVATGFSNPTFVTSFPDDASRLLVLEQYTGRISIVVDSAKQDTPFLDIDAKVHNTGPERGLFSMTFHPNYANNGRFYVCYSDNLGATILEEYLVSDDPDVADPASGEILLRIPQPRSNHNGGMIAFSPEDDFLYMALGDGGSANDPSNNAQNLETVLGKMLRLDVDAPDLVPQGNPTFQDPDASEGDGESEGGSRRINFRGPKQNVDPLIWAYGLRNPWRFSFDSQNGNLYIGDVGQSSREEIDVQPASSMGGENYGWRIAEGSVCRGGARGCADNEGFTPPVHDYTRAFGQSVTGGYVYRGSDIAGLAGVYFFGDFVSSRIWTFRYRDGGITEFAERTAELGDFDGISSFGQDADGEIYICDYGAGAIYRIVPVPEDEA